ncbi:hypothetical protein I7I53_08491 [Histoplasma capsulatum var. duboisii H88]|uniref:Uncharacterized protein n=1 Tax=Ajellomyces capsulatus (strain H88) TaxID=544711 RepID=A0A8A1LGW9_AJEC8|nr:hypothetical protein I7I53_08491 [Histoplasma capsulatum var. duboisii H88]
MSFVETFHTTDKLTRTNTNIWHSPHFRDIVAYSWNSQVHSSHCFYDASFTTWLDATISQLC